MAQNTTSFTRSAAFHIRNKLINSAIPNNFSSGIQTSQESAAPIKTGAVFQVERPVQQHISVEHLAGMGYGLLLKVIRNSVGKWTDVFRSHSVTT
ncbi:hypothetical protein EYF80_020593 [Liparis tanakae]|uniref:Uncharacterized protein n=1 Tax=Liparis tanakae TaxID=230148 RepID=A0A4Z2HTE4_9TELE|nr:hypothetical protein EYF80_020593 [Liparis tanakae]